jgi:ribonuclease HI
MDEPKPEEAAQNPKHWLMFYDGAKCKNGTRARVVLISLEGDATRYAIQIDFMDPTPTNNIAEYERLLIGLQTAISLGIRRLLVKGDSEVVAQQTRKGYRATNENMPHIYKHIDSWKQNLMDLTSNISHESLTRMLTHSLVKQPNDSTCRETSWSKCSQNPLSRSLGWLQPHA